MWIFTQFAFNVNPIAISKYLVAQVGSGIGTTASIPPNPFNTLAQQLEEKEETLLKKEGELQQKESVFQERVDKEQNSQSRTLTYLLAGGGVLLILVLLNFYLDFRRKQSTNE